MTLERGSIPPNEAYLVGAVKRPDDTLDTSRAARYKPSKEILKSQEEYDRGREELQKINEERRQQELNEMVGPGTAGRVRELLSSGLGIAKKKEKGKDDRIDRKIKLLELQLEIFNTAKDMCEEDLKKEEGDYGKFSENGLDAKASKLSAAKLEEKVAEIIMNWEDRLAEKTRPGQEHLVQMGDSRGMSQLRRVLETKLKAAKELQQKLIAEATAGKQ